MFHSIRKSWRLSLMILALFGALFCLRESPLNTLGVSGATAFAAADDGWDWWGWWYDDDDGTGEGGDDNNE